MKVVGRNKRKECEIKGGTEVDGDDAIIDGGRKRQCRNGFIRYFSEVVRQMKANDGMTCITKEIRKEIGSTYKNLPAEEKCRYKSEAKRVGKSKIGKAKFLTRCAPDRLAAAVSQLTDEQRVAVREMGFGSLLQLNCGRLKRNLCGWLVEKIDIARCILQLNGVEVELSPKSFSYVMGISDGGNPLQLEGESSEVSAYLEKFTPTSRGINITVLAGILQKLKSADDQFKVTFMMFALCTILCPPGGVHISCGFLFSLKDVQSIQKRNWATFCFHRLIQGITRHKEEQVAYVGGCLLYLQMLYFNSIVYGKLERDRSMCPLALWNVYEIKKLMKWIENKGGFDSHKVPISSTSTEGCQLHSRINYEKANCGVINTAGATDTYMKADNVSNLVDDVAKLVSLSSRLAGHVDKLKSLGSRTMNGGVENWKDCSKCFNTRKGQLCVDGYNQVRPFADGELAENNEDEIMKSLGDVVGIEETNGAHGGIVNEGEVECSNNLTTDGNCEVLHAVSPICSGFTGESNRLGLSKKQADLSGTRPSPVVRSYREHAGYRAGPYIMPMPLSNNEARLLEFAMNVMLDKGEVVMKSKHNSITRNEILSMAPRSLVKFEIVSAIAEILTEHEIKNVECEHSSCFMSAAISQQLEGGDTESACILPSCKLCNFYDKDLTECDKIFIAVNHGYAHWYILLVIIPEVRAEIWDPLRSGLTSNKLVLEAQCVLRELDLVACEHTPKVRSASLKFQEFRVHHCRCSIPGSLPSFDCALYCVLLMEKHKHYMKHPLELQSGFHSDGERARLVIKLLTWESNSLRNHIVDSAQSFFSTSTSVAEALCEAVCRQRRLQLKKSTKMGHGRRK